MNNFASLGRFLIVGFIFPGAIITTALLVMFPDLRDSLSADEEIEVAGVLLAVAFIAGHFAHIAEVVILDWFWKRCWWGRKFNMTEERLHLVDRRAGIIACAEAKKVDHSHYDETLGVFVMMTNTAFWLVIIAAAKIVDEMGGWIDDGSIDTTLTAIAGIVLGSSVASLLFSSPYFKKSYLDILEKLEEHLKAVDTEQ